MNNSNGIKNYYTIVGFKNVLIGFVVVILIALFNALFSSGTIQQSKNTIHRITKVINPYVETMDEFNLLVTRSKMFATNWVYLQQNETDKKSLIALHEKEYPSVKSKLNEYVAMLGTQTDVDTMSEVFLDFEELLKAEKEIMATLASFDDYETPIKKFGAEELIESEVIPRSDKVIEKLKKITTEKREEANQMKERMISSFNRLVLGVVISAGGLLVLVLLAGFFTTKSIKKPVMKMRNVVMRLGKGELPEENLKVTQDVIGDMVESVNILSNSFTKTATFANEIGKGNLDAEFTPLSEKDMLGKSLIEMRKSLKLYSESMEEKVTERTQQVMEKSKQLEYAYKEIQDSINYAKRIQEAISPSNELIFRIFKNAFILYKPKAIVSGDFYWFSQNENEVILAAVDCTGHGVPGAFMTVIGNSLLNQIVNLGGIFDSAKILNQLDRRLKETLQQHGVAEKTNDGMDVAVINYNRIQNKISFSGANRSLYLFRAGEFNEIPGDRFPIGSFQFDYPKLFVAHALEMKTGDTLYLFTDGYQDQFSKNGKKFLKKRFRDLLVKIHTLPMKEQQQKLENEMAQWRGNAEQTDDILVIGIRV